MRVLLVTPSYFPIIGGSEVLTRILATKLNDSGINADIMTLNMNEKWNPLWKEETVKIGEFEVLREPALNPLPHLPNPLFNLLRVNVVPKPSFLRKLRNYDVIHFVGETDLGFPLLSYFVRKPKLLQCVEIFRNGGIYKYYMVERVSFGKIFKRYFPRLADKFVVASDQDRELLLNMGVPEDKLLNIPMAVDSQFFRPSHARKADNLILFVGRIQRIKGLHILLKALQYLKAPIQLVVVGPQGDVEYAKQIEEMSRAINDDGVHKSFFLGGLDQSGLVSWYQRASVVVCPYLYEDYSNVVREALACGTPIVSTGTHIVKNGNDGILVTSRNPEEVAAAVRKLLEDRQMREEYGKAGRETVERYFSWESVTQKYLRAYQDMLRA